MISRECRLVYLLIILTMLSLFIHFFVFHKEISFKPVLTTSQVKNLKCPVTKRYQIPHGPLVAIVSFPGSGNTWSRFLIEEASGYYTGTVYPQADYRAFPGSGRYNGSVVAIKTHRLYMESLYKGISNPPDNDLSMLEYDKAIVLIRHPRDAILADTNRQLTDNPVGFMNITLTGL